ncbi:hypothetical protein Lal_00038557 [Lupinus albus]|nr:hypothetical protein Lal_00038557 [Lupinus albus]
MVGMRKDPKVGGGVGGTCEVAKNQTQHLPSDFGSSNVAIFRSSDISSFGSSDVASFGSSDVASFGSSDVASFGSSDVANFGSRYVAWFSKNLGLYTPCTGELYYFRMMLTMVKGPSSYKDIRIDDREYIEALREAKD